MVSCLILYRSDITSWIKCFLLRAIFMEEDFEIHVIESSTVILFAWNVDKASIWQAAMLFESAGVLTGYGFGKRKKPLILPPRLFLLSAKRWIIRIGIAFMKHVQTMSFNISTTKKHGLSRNHLCFP